MSFRKQTLKYLGVKAIMSTTYSQTVQGKKMERKRVREREEKADVPDLNIWGK